MYDQFTANFPWRVIFLPSSVAARHLLPEGEGKNQGGASSYKKHGECGGGPFSPRWQDFSGIEDAVRVQCALHGMHGGEGGGSEGVGHEVALGQADAVFA